MSEFFMTQMGRAFYEGTMPRIAQSLEKIAEALEKPKEHEPFVCTCGYGGFEFSGRFIKCMKCGTVYR